MPIAPGSMTDHGLCCTHHASHFCAPGWPQIVASRPKGAPVLSEQTVPTIRLSIMELRRPQVFAEEATEQTFRDCGTASIEPVEHVESLLLIVLGIALLLAIRVRLEVLQSRIAAVTMG
jgi:hypothetical protein